MTGRIPVDGALAALRERMRDLGRLVNGASWAPEYMALLAAVECLAEAIAPHPDGTTPEGVLRDVAALVKLLPSDRPELWFALPVDVAATLPGAQVTVQPRQGEPGKMLHVVRATVDGLLVVALETRDVVPEVSQ